VLDVTFLNPDTIRIQGVFNLPDDVRAPTPPHVSLEISDSEMIFQPENGRFEHSCAERISGPIVSISENH
jgi:hypothetical protein